MTLRYIAVFVIGVALVGAVAAVRCGAPASAAQDRQAPEEAIQRALEAAEFVEAYELASHLVDDAEASGGDKLELAIYVDDLALAFFEAGSGDEAAMLFERGVELRESVVGPDGLPLAEPLENLATLYYILERYADAVAPQRRALAIHEKHLPADDIRIAISRRELAAVFHVQARFTEAEPLFRDALAQVERDAADAAYIAEFNRDLAENCRAQNNFVEAQTRFVQALALARTFATPETGELAGYLNNLAGLYRDMGRFDEAERLLEESYEILIEAQIGDELADAALNLAEVYRFQGRDDDAETYYLDALALAGEHLHELSTAEFHNQLASLYRDIGRTQDALVHYGAALDILTQSPYASPLVVAQTQHDVAEFLREQGEFEAALERYDAALALRQGILGAEHPLVASTQIGIAEASTRNLTRFDEVAFARVDDAVQQLSRTRLEPASRAAAYNARSRLYYLNGNVPAAIDDMNAAVVVIEELRPLRGGGDTERIRFLGEYLDYFGTLIRWQMEAGRVEDALMTAQRERARVLADQLAFARVERNPPTLAADIEPLRKRQQETEARLRECQSRVRFLRTRRGMSENERDALRLAEAECDRLAEEYRRIYVRIRDAHGTVDGAAIVATDEIRRDLLSDNAALVLYHIGRQGSYAFLLRPESDEVLAFALVLDRTSAAVLGADVGPVTESALDAIIMGDDVADNASSLLARLQTRPERATYEQSLAELTSQLAALFAAIVPGDLWSRIVEREHVVIIPHGTLSALPFEALVVDGGSFWIEQGPAVRYIPSVSALQVLTRRSDTARTGGVLSVGDPIYDRGVTSVAASHTSYVRGAYERGGGSLGRLPGTAEESRSVVRAYGADRVEVLQQLDATESAVRTAIHGRRVVHLATHALVSAGQTELLASLALTPPAIEDPPIDNDGFLQLFEIYDLRLNADIVVLSACKTHAGRHAPGEGVTALSRAFHVAGADRVVASLWEVDDASTAQLVGSFFETVAQEERDGASPDYTAVLHDVKRRIHDKRRWAHPYFWAPFIISGSR